MKTRKIIMCLSAMMVLFLGCKKHTEIAPDETIDISIITAGGITSYKIQKDGNSLLVKEHFHALDEIYDFEFTAQEMDSIRKSIKKLKNLPGSGNSIDENNYCIVIKADGTDIKLYANRQDNKNPVNDFAHNLDDYFSSSKMVQVFRSREGLVYPPPPPPPAPDLKIYKMKFVEPEPGN